MSAYDDAEVCELVGIYLLSVPSNKSHKECKGLYRDDGLAVFKSVSGPQSEKIKKDFHFKSFLKLEIMCNLSVVGYLDVTFNLKDGSYKP